MNAIPHNQMLKLTIGTVFRSRFERRITSVVVAALFLALFGDVA